jgi:hypothetical protein
MGYAGKLPRLISGVGLKSPLEKPVFVAGGVQSQHHSNESA